jgi:hypothetical protein
MAIYSVRDCAHCGKAFQPFSSHSRHCSAECRFKGIASAFSGDGCWEWPKSRNKQTGYGQFTVVPVPNQKVVSTHRLSYQLFVGDIPPGMCIMHKCDNRGCFNPAHLQVGTLADNNRDMVAKGRHAAANKPPSTVCYRGHAKIFGGDGQWRCRVCTNEGKRALRAVQHLRDIARG